MALQKKTVQARCSDCGGTGIYLSPTCYSGAGMVCENCKGKGYVELSYTPFTSRKRIKGVKKVFEAKKYGVFFPKDHTFEDGTTVNYSEFGCTYEEWENGATPKPWPEDTPPV